MTIAEGCFSLKLECALRDLGFVEVGWRVIAHAGLFFVSPVGFEDFGGVSGDLLGFQIYRDKVPTDGVRADLPLFPSAKKALDIAILSSRN